VRREMRHMQRFERHVGSIVAERGSEDEGECYEIWRPKNHDGIIPRKELPFSCAKVADPNRMATKDLYTLNILYQTPGHFLCCRRCTTLSAKLNLR
jgi:hypothetical protein